MEQTNLDPGASPCNNFIPIRLDLLPLSQDEELSNESHPVLNDRVLHVSELSRAAAFVTTLEAVQYGVYDSKPAALIVFQCEFQYSGNHRFTEAIIEFGFFQPPPTSLSLYPVIANHEPKQLFTQAIHHSSSRTYQFGALAGPSNHTVLGVSISTTSTSDGLTWGTTTSTVRPLSRRSKEILNRVVYLIEENRAVAKGVPRLFKGAVVVLHQKAPFQGMIKVEVKHGGMVGKARDLLRRKGESGRPCLFSPSYPMGSLDDTMREGMDWKDMDLKQLVKLPTLEVERMGEVAEG